MHCARIEDPTSSKSERDHYSLCYGVNRESKLALLEPFDVTKQLPQDVMHVLLEGIAPINSSRVTPQEYNYYWLTILYAR